MSDDISVMFTNPDGSLINPPLAELPALDDYFDIPRKATLKIPKQKDLSSYAIDPFGKVQITKQGLIKILGWIDRYDTSSPLYDAITVSSAENLLQSRIGQVYRFPAGTTLNQILADAPGGPVVGLLEMCNGLVERGEFQLYSGKIYKIRTDVNGIAGGTISSRYGTITAIYQGITLLSKKISVATMVAGSWFQDATDLCLWCSDSRDPAYNLIIIPGYKDTLVRLGTIEGGDASFAVAYEISAAPLWPVIQALILAKSLEWQIRYGKDGYAYLDAKSTIGRISATEPVCTFEEGKNAEVTLGVIDGLGKIQALLGQGAGSGQTQQCAAAVDHSSKGCFREAVYSMPSLFGAMLQTAASKVFSLDYSDPTIYNIGQSFQDWSLAGGDFVEIKRTGYQPVIKRIKHISYRPGGDMQIEANQRLRTMTELVKGKDDITRLLQSFHDLHNKNAWSWSLPEANIDSYTPISFEFLLASTDDSTKSSTDKTIGSGEIDPNFPFMVLLNLKIGWFTSSLLSATTPTYGHSAVGSHSSYGGKSTSAQLMTAHNVPQITAIASGAEYGVVSGLASMGTAGAHTHNGSLASAWRQCENYKGTKLDVYSLDWYLSSIASVAGHNHSQSYNQVWVSQNGHVHVIPAQTTDAAAAQSHTGAVDPALARAGSAEHPIAEVSLDMWLNQQPTGSSVHYLTLDVKVNGVEVPGSPFSGDNGTGMYIGDSLGSLDISSLVTVGIKNSIAVTLTEWGGAGPVKCSISGNVNVNAVISAF